LSSPRWHRLGGAWPWLEKPLDAAWKRQIFFGLGAAWLWLLDASAAWSWCCEERIRTSSVAPAKG
jgi:hypothetical protein